MRPGDDGSKPRGLISQRLRARVPTDIGDSPEVPLYMHYDPAAPAEVSMFIGQPGREVHWIFARSLLLVEYRRLGVQGDIRIMHNGRGDTHILLSTPEGSATLIIDGHALASWLRRTCDAVPPDAESEIYMEQFDAEMAGIL